MRLTIDEESQLTDLLVEHVPIMEARIMEALRQGGSAFINGGFYIYQATRLLAVQPEGQSVFEWRSNDGGQLEGSIENLLFGAFRSDMDLLWKLQEHDSGDVDEPILLIK